MIVLRAMTSALALLCMCTAAAGGEADLARDGSQGPLGEWPDFTPIGFITAPHPDDPGTQTYLYGDWGGIVGEELIFLEDGLLKLLYHSYHETCMTQHAHEEEIVHDWALGYDKVTKVKFTPLVRPGGPNPGPAWVPHLGEHGKVRLFYGGLRPHSLLLVAGLGGHLVRPPGQSHHRARPVPRRRSRLGIPADADAPDRRRLPPLRPRLQRGPRRLRAVAARTYLAVASRPDVTAVEGTPSGGSGPELVTVAPNPGLGAARLEFLLSEPEVQTT